MHTLSATPPPPLERARDRLRRSGIMGHDCYDDLAAPGWISYRRSRARFLGRPEPPVPPVAHGDSRIPSGDGR